MTDSFNDDSTKFMTNLLKLLEKEAQNISAGESLRGQETASSVLLRLVGVTKTPSLDKTTAGEANAPAIQVANLVDSYFKIQTNRTNQQLSLLNTLLKTYRSRLTRYSRARSEIKLKRTKKLIEEPSKPLKANELVKDDPTQTRKNITEKQKELRKAGDLKGILDQDIQLHKALETSVNRTVSIPTEAGTFASQLNGFVTATAKEANDQIEQLELYKQEVQNEVNRLENTDKLLFEGSKTFDNTDKTLSLLQILDLLIFLTDRKKAKYDCSQCKHFRKAKTDACVFVGSGSTSPSPIVNLTDEQGNPVTGRLTKPTNSCKNVWNLESNEYFTMSDNLVETLKKLLET